MKSPLSPPLPQLPIFRYIIFQWSLINWIEFFQTFSKAVDIIWGRFPCSFAAWNFAARSFAAWNVTAGSFAAWNFAAGSLTAWNFAAGSYAAWIFAANNFAAWNVTAGSFAAWNFASSNFGLWAPIGLTKIEGGPYEEVWGPKPNFFGSVPFFRRGGRPVRRISENSWNRSFWPVVLTWPVILKKITTMNLPRWNFLDENVTTMKSPRCI